MIRLGVTGRPILQSRSPELHRAFLGDEAVCSVRLAADTAKEAVTLAKLLELRGMNVTAPFKETLLSELTVVDDSARRTKAANTVLFNGRAVEGYNTDVDGVLGALKGAAPKIAFVLGSGGAARAAVVALQALGAAVTVVSRRIDPEICPEFGVSHLSLADPHLVDRCREADCIVNTTSTLDAVLPIEAFSPSQLTLDCHYARTSAFARDSAATEQRSSLQWFLSQGKRSIELYTGQSTTEIAEAPKGRTYSRRLALVGMMGVGKSSTALHLSKLLGWSQIEMDDEIERRAGMKIERIFSENGEDRFRELEAAVLQSLPEHSVISCGGGAVLKPDNRRYLFEQCLTVSLWASPEEILRRIGDDRPLLRGKGPNEASALFQRRRDLYLTSSHLAILSEGRSPEEVAARIYEESRIAYPS